MAIFEKSEQEFAKQVLAKGQKYYAGLIALSY
jgi:hypothetical protein